MKKTFTNGSLAGIYVHLMSLSNMIRLNRISPIESRQKITGRWLVLAFIMTLAFPPVGWTADENYSFAAKGAAVVSCEAFVTERKQPSNVYSIMLGWIDGYVSAYNNLTADTYDVTPWQSTEVLAAMLDSHCKKHSQELLVVSMGKLIKLLEEQRLKKRSEYVVVSVGELKVQMYTDVVVNIQKMLKKKGYLTGKADGIFGSGSIKALKKFQKNNKLDVTGFPDQRTMVFLFLQ